MAKCILLVDDETHILRAAEFTFQRSGYEVFCAENGLDAWEQMLEHAPDIVVTDFQMPGLNGLQLVERMRGCATLKEVPVLLLTAKGFELPRQEICRRYDILAVVTKPFSPRDLFRRVEKALENAPAKAPSEHVTP